MPGLASARTKIGDEPEGDEPSTYYVPTAIEALDFEEALDVGAFARAMSEAANRALQQTGRQASSDEESSQLTLARLAQEGNLVYRATRVGEAHYLLAYSKQHDAMLRAGKLVFQGGTRPTLVDPATGKIVAHGWVRPVGPVRRAGMIAANVYNVALTASYMLVSMDTLRRLEALHEGINLLLAAHRFEQLGRLESIYGRAKEALARPLDLRGQLEIDRLRQELLELRSTWARELHYKLYGIKDPHKDTFRNLLAYAPLLLDATPVGATPVGAVFSHELRRLFKDYLNKKADSSILEKTLQGEVEIKLVLLCVLVDLELAGFVGDADAFALKTLPRDVRRLDLVVSGIQAQVERIQDSKMKQRAEQLLATTRQVRDGLARLVPEQLPDAVKVLAL